jgi:N-formylglutamate deformylase
MDIMEVYNFKAGMTPLLVSIPHGGTHVPAPIAARMTTEARALADTDWHLEQLYNFATDLGASVLAATHSRYVVDLNRPPDGAALYPGADNTELCPTTTFARDPIYHNGEAPGAAEIDQRVATYWRPYHDKLAATLAELRATHGVALLFDTHSIASRVPRFFDGRLPDFNHGTGGGTSADPDLAAGLLAICDHAAGFTSVLNGRFTGGYITRTYGDPAANIHAVQLEQSQITYMNEDAPFAYRPDRADDVRPVLKALLGDMLAWGNDHAGH